MRIQLYKDETIDIDLKCIVENVSRYCPDWKIEVGRSGFVLADDVISSPSSYRKLPKPLLRESVGADLVLLFTEKPYENNYFFEGFGNRTIISLWAWDHLTQLSRNNGAVFFLCARLMQDAGIGIRHDETTGCINDFWMDKTGVDLGMRSGKICVECLAEHRKKGRRISDDVVHRVQGILGDVAAASRTESDVCKYWSTRTFNGAFDVFLCHNSQEKDAVRTMNAMLQKRGIQTWFDEEQLPPGRMWQQLLEEQIQQIRTAAVIVGESGIGPWQDVELRAFLGEFVRRSCPVIPVILSDCRTVPQLPLFLKQFTWVDFRKSAPDPYALLQWGITGRRP